MARRTAVLLLALALVFSATPIALGETAGTVAPLAYGGAERIAGANRYDTSAKASQEAFPTGTNVVLIATGTNWPDALCAAPLAVSSNAPLLLVKPTSLPAEVKAEINRLGANTAVILGGDAAVSPTVEAQIINETTVVGTMRIAGTNRYDTAEKIAAEVMGRRGIPASGQLFVATGANFPDALAAAPVAGARGMPILLTPKDYLSSDAISFLQTYDFNEAVIVGGTGVISETVRTQLDTYVSGTPWRIAGLSRFDTAKEMFEVGAEEFGMDATHPGVAYGRNFPDALAAGVVLAYEDQSLLLCDADRVSTPAARVFCDNRAVVEDVRLFGGTAVIDPCVEDHILTVLVPESEIPGRVPAHVDSWLSDSTPTAGTDVMGFAEVYDQYGLPLPLAKVGFNWFFPDDDWELNGGPTDEDGRISVTMHVPGVAANERCDIEIVVTRNGGMSSSSLVFWPVD